METAGFILRPWRCADGADVARCANDPAIARNLRDAFPHPYTPEDGADFVDSCVAREGEGQLCRAIEVDGRAVGSIGLFRGADVYCKSAELGYWLARDCWGRGIMTRAVIQLCREGFGRWDILRIYAEPFARNAASRRVLEKAGFTLEGVLRQGAYKWGEVLDTCVYGLLRGEAGDR